MECSVCCEEKKGPEQLARFNDDSFSRVWAHRKDIPSDLDKHDWDLYVCAFSFFFFFIRSYGFLDPFLFFFLIFYEGISMPDSCSWPICRNTRT